MAGREEGTGGKRLSRITFRMASIYLRLKLTEAA